jgi:hypothetical protein
LRWFTIAKWEGLLTVLWGMESCSMATGASKFSKFEWEIRGPTKPSSSWRLCLTGRWIGAPICPGKPLVHLHEGEQIKRFDLI